MLESFNDTTYQPRIPEIKTTHAVLLHTTTSKSDLALDIAHVANASLHTIKNDVLQPGAMISKNSLIKLLMSGESRSGGTDDWLEPNVLMDSANWLIWYQPVKERPIVVRNTSDKHGRQETYYVKFPKTTIVVFAFFLGIYDHADVYCKSNETFLEEVQNIILDIII